MKKIYALLAVGSVIVSFVAVPAGAIPVGRNNEAINYLFKDPVLTRVTAGLYTGQTEREVTLGDSPSITRTLSGNRTTGYLGLSVLSWLNVYGLVGQNTAEIEFMSEGDAEMALGFGVSVNLLNHFIREPIPMEDAFRLNLGAQYLSLESDIGYDTLAWDEISASLTLSIVNHLDGNKNYRPESIALYIGPAFSTFRGDAISAETEGGVIGGVEIFITDSVSLDLGFEYFDTANLRAGVNVHF
ncbi:MAG TPA: hypothetical protein DCS43_10205 [Verrucomicrobia bacterium]|nr:hypothetical protein [Verrucomicrobiota bacterium]